MVKPTKSYSREQVAVIDIKNGLNFNTELPKFWQAATSISQQCNMTEVWLHG